MKKNPTALLVLVALGLAIAVAPAPAHQVIGGTNVTSEVNAPLWAVGSPTPGGVPGLASSHLLISEVVVTPTASELIEIHNPTASDIDLTNYYLTDAWFIPTGGGTPTGYYQLPTGTFSIGTNTDFCARFPGGSIIPAFGTQVIAMYGPGVDSIYGPGTANYEVTSVSPTIPDMIHVGNNVPAIGAGATTLTNNREFVMLFQWDGGADNVCDVDYVTWGPIDAINGSSRVNKTGLSTDGPDAGTTATPYFPDTPAASQSSVAAPGLLLSVARKAGAEGAETSGGNGCTLAPVTVLLDFNPGVLNLNSRGRWVTAYLEVVPPHTASDIDVSSLLLEGSVPVDPDGPVTIGDADGDGVPDLMVKFSRAAVTALLSPGDGVVIDVTGSLAVEHSFTASDVIKVIQVTLPNPAAGSVVLAGSQVDVTWDNPNGPLTADLLVSYDDGATWSIEARNLPNNGHHTWTAPSINANSARVAMVTIAHEGASDLVVSHEYGQSGAFAIDAVTGVGDGPVALAIRGVHPNPGRGSLNVSFSLPNADPARLVVYDVSGREMARRDLGGLGAGQHLVSFGQGERLLAGVYLVQLSQGARNVRLRAVVIE